MFDRTAPADPLRAKLIRAGIIVFVVGLLSSMLGAVILALGSLSWEGFGHFVHRAGQYLMLAGLIILLGGLRARQIRLLLDPWPSKRSGSGSRESTQLKMMANTPRIICFFAALFLLTLIIQVALPIRLLSLGVVALHAAVTAAFVVIAVYDRGKWQTFSVGVLVVLIPNASGTTQWIPALLVGGVSLAVRAFVFTEKATYEDNDPH